MHEGTFSQLKRRNGRFTCGRNEETTTECPKKHVIPVSATTTKGSSGNGDEQRSDE
jgi:hypothetical protein